MMRELEVDAGWHFRKIVSRARRDPWYVVKRPSYAIRKRLVDARFLRSSMARRADLSARWRSVAEASITDHYSSRKTPVWLFTEGEVPGIVSGIPRLDRERILARATALADGRFEFRGHKAVDLGSMDWHTCPHGDITWTKDLNRHGWFETLGCAYRCFGEDRFAEAFLEKSSSWIDQFGGRIGRAVWDDPFEVARRINSWMWSFFLFLDCPQWSEADRCRFLRVLGLLAEYLYQTVEYHSAGNHILLESKALALVGEAFPEFNGSNRWRSKGWKILERELESQICTDGVHAERSTMYHRIIAGELCELWRFSTRNSLPQANRLEETVLRMAEFQRSIEFGNGEYPMFGDARSADTYYRFSAPAILDGIKGRGPIRLEKGVGDLSWWVLADRGVTEDAVVPEGSIGAGSKAYTDGGYFVSRSGVTPRETVLIWDCGPMGDYSNANRTHGHADALQLVASIRGTPFLIDPGVGAARFVPAELKDQSGYSAARLRRTKAHNTVCVDGEDQAVLAARGEIWNAPLPRLLLWASCEECDIMSGLHDGYSRLKNPVLHERSLIVMRDSYWLIVDHLWGSGFHVAEHGFHFAPGADVSIDSKTNRCRVLRGESELTMSMFSFKSDRSPSLRLEECLGELDNGSPTPIPVLRSVSAGTVPISTGTLLVPCREQLDFSAATEGETDCTVEVRGAAFVDRVFVCKEEPVLRALESNWRADGRIAVFRHDINGTLIQVLIAGATEIFYEQYRFELDREISSRGDVFRYTPPVVVSQQ